MLTSLAPLHICGYNPDHIWCHMCSPPHIKLNQTYDLRLVLRGSGQGAPLLALAGVDEQRGERPCLGAESSHMGDTGTAASATFTVAPQRLVTL